jgi:dual specificity phosphatase 12
MKSHRSFHAALIIEGLLLGDKMCSMSKKELL